MTNSQSNQKRKLRTTDPEFEPPDGGWGWMVVLAAGTSNFCIYPVLQQFGLLFRDKFNSLGITSSQTTTLFNLNLTSMCFVGLANGPIFRKYSFRKVSLFGALVCTIALIINSQASTFVEYIISISILYGIGLGISQSANALAINTYFKKKRRIATGFSWTATGLGPVIFPYIVSFLLELYGVEGSVLILAGIAFNSVICACLLQPVHWHTQYKSTETNEDHSKPLMEVSDGVIENETTNNFKSNLTNRTNSQKIFSSQYLFNEDDRNETGYEIIDPSYPMLSKANDGWYGSKLSLRSVKESNHRISKSSMNSFKNESKRNSVNFSKSDFQISSSRRSSHTGIIRNERKHKKVENLNIKKPKDDLTIPERNVVVDVDSSIENLSDDKHASDTKNLQENINKKFIQNEQLQAEALKSNLFDSTTEMNSKIEETLKKITICEKIALFFDLDLLKDWVYVNIAIGITLASFAEMNFTGLTPFILIDFGFEKHQVSVFMSLLAGVDITVRFVVPFIASKIDWSNRTFFLVGISLMAFGRILLAHNQEYAVSLLIAVIIGTGKALRTIFIALAIPSHVPLLRLPGATGLQLLFNGLFSLAMAPLIGLIQDTTKNYVITLYCLNIFTMATVISWSAEKIVQNRNRFKKK